MAQLNERQKDFLRWWVGEETAGNVPRGFVSGARTLKDGLRLAVPGRKGRAIMPEIGAAEVDDLVARKLLAIPLGQTDVWQLTPAGRRAVADDFKQTD